MKSALFGEGHRFVVHYQSWIIAGSLKMSMYCSFYSLSIDIVCVVDVILRWIIHNIQRLFYNYIRYFLWIWLADSLLGARACLSVRFPKYSWKCMQFPSYVWKYYLSVTEGSSEIKYWYVLLRRSDSLAAIMSSSAQMSQSTQYISQPQP